MKVAPTVTRVSPETRAMGLSGLREKITKPTAHHTQAHTTCCPTL